MPQASMHLSSHLETGPNILRVLFFRLATSAVSYQFSQLPAARRCVVWWRVCKQAGKRRFGEFGHAIEVGYRSVVVYPLGRSHGSRLCA
jgi:hypothetical protein